MVIGMSALCFLCHEHCYVSFGVWELIQHFGNSYLDIETLISDILGCMFRIEVCLSCWCGMSGV